MNFSGNFDAKLSHSVPASFDGEKFNFDSKPGFVLNHDASSAVVIPDAHLLFSGDYKRIGNDLIISTSDQKFVVGNYFKGDTRPSLATKDGATLSGHIVDALTGHVMYAQAAAPAGAAVCGHVLKLTGSATVIRNGVSVELHIGDAIQKGDVVQTGSDSSIGMTLVDGSAFGMTSNARMVINEMIYDPNGSSNSSLISLVQGTITFVAGQTAKNGNMRVDTPVATMGIRGTAVLVEISANDGPTKFSVLVEPDGHTGSYNLYDKTTGQLLGTVSQAGQVTFVTSTGLGLPATATEQPKTLQDQQTEKALIQQVFQLYFPNYNPDDSKPNSTKPGPRTDIGVPDNSAPKYAFDPTTGRPTLTVPTLVTNPETGKTTVVNITFANTPPIFRVSDATDVQATPTDNLGPHSFKLGDHVRIIDPDIGVAVFYDEAVPYVTNTGQITQTTGPESISTNTAYLLDPSLITLNRATGVVTYNPEAFRFLGEGETAVYKFKFTSASGPDSAPQQLIFTVTGHNDAPVFAVNDTPLAFSETAHQTGQSTSHLIVPIQLNFTDEDYSDVASSFTLSASVSTKITGTHSTTPDLSKLPDSNTLKSYLKIVADGIDTNLGVSRTLLSDAGQITAKFTAPDKVFDFLAEGEQIQLVYTIVVTDAHGASDTQTVTITVTGTNDVPVIAAGDVAQVTTIHEMPDQTGIPTADTSPGGSIHFSDVDLTDRPTASIAAQTATYTSADGQTTLTPTPDQLAAIKAGFTITPGTNDNNGVIDWDYSINDDQLDFLSQDEVISLVTIIEVTDHHGGTATATVTVNIHKGANDKPVVSPVSDVPLVEQSDQSLLQQTIVAQFSDADLTETGHTASVQKVVVTGVTPPGTQYGALTSGTLYDLLSPGTVTKLSGKSVGTAEFNFNANSNVFDYLAVGEVVTLVYTIAVTDAANASDTQTITITVTGTNDTPVIASADLAGAVTEQCYPTGSLTDSGTIAFHDVDLSDTHVIDPTVTASTGALGLLTAEVMTDTSGGTGGEIAWQYIVNSSAVEYLAAGESKLETFTITLDDGHGGTVSQTIEVTITGTNDAPVVETIAATSLTEPTDQSDLTSPITVAFADADLADTGHTATITDVSASGHQTGLSLCHTALIGLVTIDAVTKASGSTAGEVDLHFSAPSSAFDYLAPNECVTLTYTISVDDGHSGGTGTQTFTVTITGTNDAPVLAASTPQLTTISEDQVHNCGQTVASFLGNSISDADHNAQTGIAVTGAASSHGHWEFSIDGGAHWDGFGTYSTSSALLLAGSDLIRFVPDGQDGGTDTFSYVAWDGTTGTHGEHADASVGGGDSAFSTGGDTATITVAPVNDAPVIDVDNVHIATGGGVATISGLSVSDADDSDGVFTVMTTAENGTVSPSGGTGVSLPDLNSALQNGVTYTPDFSTVGHVELTVTDAHGLSDTVNFIFEQQSSSGVVLVGGAGTDVMIGGAGNDQFVFGSGSGHDVITNFTPGQDTIVLEGLNSVSSEDSNWFETWSSAAIAQHGADTLIHLDGTDTVLLKNVSAANLHANDFVIPPTV
ncbi:VCBS repeat-containing protein [Nitrobacteraceae bacterium AZCC 1564]